MESPRPPRTLSPEDGTKGAVISCQMLSVLAHESFAPTSDTKVSAGKEFERSRVFIPTCFFDSNEPWAVYSR